MASTIPRAFFAYPASGPTLKEPIREAVCKLNAEGQITIQTWEQCNIGGKLVINTICDAIDKAELFFADLTGLNANVMFELGYAIARDKRIWLILDDSYTKQQNMFEQLKILTTVGYISCCNSQDIVSGFNKDNPIEDMENTIFRAIKPTLTPEGYDSILYLKSQHENQAAMHMSSLLQKRFPNGIIVDDPSESAVQSLTWYGNRVYGCNGLVCHFTNPKRDGAYLQTARYALICGMARGFEKPLLMLAEGEFLSPIDYRDYLEHYHTALEALGYLKEWIPRVERDLKVDQETTTVPRLKIFITYSHADTNAKDKLRRCLAVMEQQNKLVTWHDGDITAGSNVRQEHILKEVADSDILLYLVSTDSLASENCNKELTEALKEGKRIIPIILENCDWLNDRLSGFQALPDKGKPVNKWEYESDGWQNVVAGIRKVVEEIQAQADSPSRISEKERRAESVVGQDNVLMTHRQIDKSIGHDSQAVKLERNNAEAYFDLGDIYHSKKDYDHAIEAFTKAIVLKKDFAAAYTNRGVSYHSKGDYDLAIADHNKAIDLNPDYAEAYFNRGVAYKSKDNYDFATKDFTRAIEIRGDFAGAYNHRGVAYSDKGDYDLKCHR